MEMRFPLRIIALPCLLSAGSCLAEPGMDIGVSPQGVALEVHEGQLALRGIAFRQGESSTGLWILRTPHHDGYHRKGDCKDDRFYYSFSHWTFNHSSLGIRQDEQTSCRFHGRTRVLPLKHRSA